MVKLTKAITHSVGADWSLLDFPKLCSNSAVRGHSIREPSHPNGNQPSMVMRSAKRWKTPRPHGIAECPPDGHGQTQHRLAKAAKRLARSLSLGAMNLDVEERDKTKQVRRPSPLHTKS